MHSHEIEGRLHTYLLPWLLLLADFTVLWGGTWLIGPFLEAMGLHPFIPRYWHLLLPALFCLYMSLLHLYRTRRVFSECAGRMLRGALYALVTAIVIEYLLHEDLLRISRAYLLCYGLYGYAALVGVRYAMRALFTHLGIWKNRIIVIGAGKSAELFLQAFGENYHVDGLLEDDASRPLLKSYPHLGGFSDIERVLSRHPVHDVILAVPGLPKEELSALFYRVQPYTDKVSVIPDIFGVPIGNVRIESSPFDRILVLKTQNNLRSLKNRMTKRAFDLVVGGAIALCLLPVLAILALLVRRDSPGGAFYTAERIGRGDTTFPCYKFRSMYQDGDRILKEHLASDPEARAEWDTYQKLRGDDPRVTPIGKILRKYSLDELPQIFNVLKGDMSLVGPRPYLPREAALVGEYLPVIRMTTPGITGLWQVSGRSEVAFDGRIQLDAWYVRNWSLWMDIIILFRTIGVVFLKKGAY